MQTEHGDLYDCVDFYEQPAFDYPLLQNHAFRYEVAVVRTKFSGNKKYDGGGMNITIEGPKAKFSQYSMGQMKVLNGPDYIQVGWMVNPTLYGDNRARFFVYHKASH
ncbi:hypothetical protein CDL15_Pgr028119 [Punica granatum]|uniref:Neprosin PEP catalytic domain-containing protein n=1 Tax=Punica granatum TaxID=22663 RepID=A0A218XLY8_PUNGR|nr:hypothetical protein CDL15_Pgr028119 [Punica granatum]